MTNSLPIWILAFPAMLGLAAGSFLNVCILRMPAGESVVSPRSHCPKCGTTLRAWENIPVLSWIFLRGRCGHCGAKIAVMYPLVELATAVWFAWCTLQYLHGGGGAAAVFGLIGNALLGWLLIGLFATDALFGLLPDAFTLGGTMAGLLLFAGAVLFGTPPDPGHDVMATTPEKMMLRRLAMVLIAVAALLLLRLIYKLVRDRDGMGLGDVKMTAMLVAFLGAEKTALAFMAACIVGSLYAVFLLVKHLPKRGTGEARPFAVPFGSFLAIGSFYALIAGEATLRWYWSLMN